MPGVNTIGGAATTIASTFLSLPDAPNSYATYGLQVVRVNAQETGLEFVPSSGGGGTDLTYTASPTQGIVVSSTGLDAVLPLAGANAGLMSPADFTKLAGVENGATSNASNADLRDRTTHSGVQPLSSISPLVASRLVGRGSSLGTGSLEPISLGNNLQLDTTILQVTSPGSPTHIVFNIGGFLGASSSFTYNDATSTFSVPTINTSTIGTPDTNGLSLKTNNVVRVRISYEGAGLELLPNATDPIQLRFYELAANGTNYTGFRGAASQTSTLEYTWPTVAPTNNQALTWTTGGQLVWATVGGGGGATNLTTSANSTSVTILSDTGTDATIAAAVAAGNAGVLTGADKSKLDGIQNNATQNSSDSALRDRTTHSGVQGIATISPVNASRLTGRGSASSGALEELTLGTGCAISGTQFNVLLSSTVGGADGITGVGGSTYQGTSNYAARADHLHTHGSQSDPNNHALATSGAHGFMSAADKNKLDNGVLGTPDANPLNISKSAAVSGSSPKGSRQDHKHDIDTAAPTTTLTVGIGNSEGAATSLARSDHTHQILLSAGDIVSTSTTSTSSTSYVALSGMTTTPAAAGSYLVWFSATVRSTDLTAPTVTFAAHVNGNIVPGTTRLVYLQDLIGVHQVVTINVALGIASASDVIDIRWQTSFGTVECLHRTLNWLRYA